MIKFIIINNISLRFYVFKKKLKHSSTAVARIPIRPQTISQREMLPDCSFCYHSWCRFFRLVEIDKPSR